MTATLKRGLVRTRIETEQGGTQLLKGMGSIRARHEREWDSLGEKGDSTQGQMARKWESRGGTDARSNDTKRWGGRTRKELQRGKSRL